MGREGDHIAHRDPLPAEFVRETPSVFACDLEDDELGDVGHHLIRHGVAHLIQSGEALSHEADRATDLADLAKHALEVYSRDRLHLVDHDVHGPPLVLRLSALLADDRVKQVQDAPAHQSGYVSSHRPLRRVHEDHVPVFDGRPDVQRGLALSQYPPQALAGREVVEARLHRRYGLAPQSGRHLVELVAPVPLEKYVVDSFHDFGAIFFIVEHAAGVQQRVLLLAPRVLMRVGFVQALESVL